MIRNLGWVLFALLAEPWLRPRRQVIRMHTYLDGREIARAVHRSASERKVR